MRTPPDDLEAADLTAVLAVEWGLRDVGLTYAPVGFGGHHWLADVVGRPVWFVTANRPAAALEPAFRTAVALAAHGLEFVVAPVETELGEVAVTTRGWVVSVTPWATDAVDHPVEGVDVVSLAAALHGATDVVRAIASSDDLAVGARPALDAALVDLDRPWPQGPYAEHLRALLAGAADSVRSRLAAHDTRAVRIDRSRDVVTHGELKPGNLLATPHGIALVDWDTALLAPPERDLWRFGPGDLEAYTATTGRAVEPEVTAFYRERWHLSDVALFVEQLRRAPVRTDDTQTSWRALQELLR